MSGDPKDGEPSADEEFERVLRNLVNTPHKPHEKKKPNGDSGQNEEGAAP